MNFSLIICTYQRPRALVKLLQSVQLQSLYPGQILIIDGSLDSQTKEQLQNYQFRHLEYYLVDAQQRGLTKQRNFGIAKVARNAEVVCFLDDDIVLTPSYFSELLDTYKKYPQALGAGGYIIDEIEWTKKSSQKKIQEDEFKCDGFSRKLGSRHLLRKKFGLLSPQPPGVMPNFSNGLSTSFLPPSGKIYPVEFFMGGVASYKKSVFEKLQFSTYFEGYGLYEDMDFCLRLAKRGSLYVNTAAKLYHYHEESGRPNQFKYGKMVLRNGFYVWRVKYRRPGFKATLKWHATALLLLMVRLGNVLSTSKRKQALTEALGRAYGWASVILNPPKIKE